MYAGVYCHDSTVANKNTVHGIYCLCAVCPKCGYSATRTCGDLIKNTGIRITTKSTNWKAKNMGQEPNPNLEMEANHDMLHPVLHSMPIPHLVGLIFIFCWLQQQLCFENRHKRRFLSSQFKFRCSMTLHTDLGSWPALIQFFQPKSKNHPSGKIIMIGLCQHNL